MYHINTTSVFAPYSVSGSLRIFIDLISGRENFFFLFENEKIFFILNKAHVQSRFLLSGMCNFMYIERGTYGKVF